MKKWIVVALIALALPCLAEARVITKDGGGVSLKDVRPKGSPKRNRAAASEKIANPKPMVMSFRGENYGYNDKGVRFTATVRTPSRQQIPATPIAEDLYEPTPIELGLEERGLYVLEVVYNEVPQGRDNWVFAIVSNGEEKIFIPVCGTNSFKIGQVNHFEFFWPPEWNP